MELPTYGEVVKATDDILSPGWRDLVIIFACKQLLKTENYPLKNNLIFGGLSMPHISFLKKEPIDVLFALYANSSHTTINTKTSFFG